MIVPFVLVIAQLQFQYGYDGLDAGRPVLLTAHVAAGRERSAAGAKLETPAGIQADADAVWFPAARDLVWRITPPASADQERRPATGAQPPPRALPWPPRSRRGSPPPLARVFLNKILYPAEPPLPADAPLTSIDLAYPERDLVVLGWHLNWLVVFFA